jgi:hypothetical protein
MSRIEGDFEEFENTYSSICAIRTSDGYCGWISKPLLTEAAASRELEIHQNIIHPRSLAKTGYVSFSSIIKKLKL